MTLTNPGCSLASLIINDIKKNVLEIKGINHVEVDLVFDPPLTKDRLSKRRLKRLLHFFPKGFSGTLTSHGTTCLAFS